VGVNGPIVVDSGLSPANPVPLSNGAGAYTRENLATSNAIAQEILGNPAGFYFNVHSALSPGGVCRGQLVPQQTPGGLTVPTLSEWGMILMFLLLGASAVYFIMTRGSAVAMAGGSKSLSLSAPRASVNFKLFARVAMYVEVLVALGLVALSSWVTAITPVDVGGALLSGLIIAFVIHLMIETRHR
jgi:hypothetical protein